MQLSWSGQKRIVEVCIIKGTCWTVRNFYTENPKRLLLRCGRCQSFRVNGTAWTFSGTICLDRAGDESCDMVKIPRVKCMEVQGARDLPPAIQYLSVHCKIFPLVLSSGSNEVTKVPVCCFLQFATASWNFVLESWLPQSWLPDSGVWCGGGLCWNEEFEKAVAKIQHDTYHDGACPLWIDMLVQG